MENNFTVKPIGILRADEHEFFLELAPEYKRALVGLEGFSYVNILWWFSACDNQEERRVLTEKKPYANGPDVMGVFATRSPQRPNPIALSCAYVTYIDADDKSPVLDIKPYTPSLDRVEQPAVPAWCANWPSNVETSGDFDWESELNF